MFYKGLKRVGNIAFLVKGLNFYVYVSSLREHLQFNFKLKMYSQIIWSGMSHAWSVLS